MTTTFFGLAKCYTFYLYRLFVYRLGSLQHPVLHGAM